MTDPRRYDEDEIERIFDEAVKVQKERAHGRVGSRGLTLAELQEIGREVGLDPGAVASAARVVEGGGESGVRRTLGVPWGVSRVVELPRDLTDAEWQRLVALLRETFDARGRVGSAGGLRHWSNGNLGAYVEPTGAGWRLRLSTSKGSVRPVVGASLSLLGFTVALVVLSLLGFLGAGGIPPGAAVLTLLGLGTLGVGIAGLPAWARTRATQMEEVAARVGEWTALPPGEGRDGRDGRALPGG